MDFERAEKTTKEDYLTREFLPFIFHLDSKEII
jgi:hypothetical protein